MKIKASLSGTEVATLETTTMLAFTLVCRGVNTTSSSTLLLEGATMLVIKLSMSYIILIIRLNDLFPFVLGTTHLSREIWKAPKTILD